MKRSERSGYRLRGLYSFLQMVINFWRCDKKKEKGFELLGVVTCTKVTRLGKLIKVILVKYVCADPSQ